MMGDLFRLLSICRELVKIALILAHKCFSVPDRVDKGFRPYGKSLPMWQDMYRLSISYVIPTKSLSASLKQDSHYEYC